MGLTDIVVTAQRRSESLQRTALAVSAVSGGDLVNASVSDAANLTKLIPALVVQPGGGTSVNLYLRGVGTLQSNAFGENPVAFNFGGVYIARPTAPVGAFYDLDRVEVVKGPQGTLYGRNATGGAVNVIPKKPQIGRWDADVTAEYGNYDSRKVLGAVNVPIGNALALRVAGQVVDRKGYLSDGTSDEKGQAGRASLLFAPDGDWSALFMADYFHQGGKGVGGVLAPGAAFPAGFQGYSAPPLSARIGGSDPRSIAALTAYANTLAAPPFCPGGFIASDCVHPPQGDSYIDSSFYGISATIEGKTGLGTLTVLPAYRWTDSKYRSYAFGFLTDQIEHDHQFSLEVRLASPSDRRLRYVLGGFLFIEDQDADDSFYQGRLSTTHFTPKLSTDSKAVFGQATFDVTSKFRIVGGARYSSEKRTLYTRLATDALPGPVFPPLGNPFPGELDVGKVTWKGGIEWDAGPRSLVYANVATGFKSGGFFVAAPPNNTFRPESLTAYTLGSKNRFLDNKLQVNLEAFYWDYKDQQISFIGAVPTGIAAPAFVGAGTTVNAGKARLYGAEAEVRYALFPTGTLSLDVQYLNGRYLTLNYTAFSASGAPLRSGCSVSNSRLANPGFNLARLYDVDCAGQPTINSPKWVANIQYEHRFALGGDYHLVALGRTRLESSRYVTIDYLPEERQGAYTQSDASLTLESPGGHWSLTGFINNIENRTILSGAFLRPIVQTVYVSLRPPRTYGVRASYRFR